MIVCTTDEYDDARATYPDEFILCEDTRTIHPPGDLPVITISPRRTQRVVESPRTERWAN